MISSLLLAFHDSSLGLCRQHTAMKPGSKLVHELLMEWDNDGQPRALFPHHRGQVYRLTYSMMFEGLTESEVFPVFLGFSILC